MDLRRFSLFVASSAVLTSGCLRFDDASGQEGYCFDDGVGRYRPCGDAAIDAGVADAELRDADLDAAQPDTGHALDAHADDTGLLDLGFEDAALADRPPPDIGLVDAGWDAGLTDAGPADTGPPDAGQPNLRGAVFLVDGPQRSTLKAYEVGSGVRADLSALGASDRILSFEVSPDLSHVAFVVVGTAPGRRLYVSRLPSGPSTLLTSGLAAHQNAYEWSSDGSRLAFVANDRVSTIYDLYSVDPDGLNLRRLTGALLSAGGGVDDVEWSPTSDRLAFVATTNGSSNAAFYTVSGVGLGLVQVHPSPGDAMTLVRFAWAPNGSALLLIADFGSTGIDSLFVAGPTASTPQRVSLPSETVAHAAWSPNADHIAYLATSASGPTTLHAIAALTGQRTAITTSVPAERLGADAFAWSPTGHALVFRADLRTANVFELFWSDLVAAPRAVAADTGVRQFQWSQAARHVGFLASARPNPVWTASSLGLSAAPRTSTFVSGGAVSSYSWSPADPDVLAYLADQDTNDQRELYKLDVTSSQRTKLSGMLPLGAQVSRYEWLPDGSGLVYLADQDSFGVPELFLAPLVAGSSSKISGVLSTNETVSPQFAVF